MQSEQEQMITLLKEILEEQKAMRRELAPLIANSTKLVQLFTPNLDSREASSCPIGISVMTPELFDQYINSLKDQNGSRKFIFVQPNLSTLDDYKAAATAHRVFLDWIESHHAELKHILDSQSTGHKDHQKSDARLP